MLPSLLPARVLRLSTIEARIWFGLLLQSAPSVQPICRLRNEALPNWLLQFIHSVSDLTQSAVIIASVLRTAVCLLANSLFRLHTLRRSPFNPLRSTCTEQRRALEMSERCQWVSQAQKTDTMKSKTSKRADQTHDRFVTRSPTPAPTYTSTAAKIEKRRTFVTSDTRAPTQQKTSLVSELRVLRNTPRHRALHADANSNDALQLKCFATSFPSTLLPVQRRPWCAATISSGPVHFPTTTQAVVAKAHSCASISLEL